MLNKTYLSKQDPLLLKKVDYKSSLCFIKMFHNHILHEYLSPVTCHQTKEKKLRCAIVLLGILCILAAIYNCDYFSEVVLQCPPGWRMFEWSCYLISNESKSWKQSQKDCRNRGTRLVAVDSTEEQAFLSGLIEEHTMLWIGLADSIKEGTWRWVSGDPLTLSFWQTQQPDNGGGIWQFGEEDCAHITTGTNSENNWNDLSCKTSLRWICETDLATK
uniref:C-type lectin domain-containing protein n=1 Tax=Periophthalmus magnuspinnatus TaxID=409849 RepID=A0A3B3ZW51_9GOBI